MGFLSFLKNIFTGESADEKKLDEARARHGIVLTAKDKAEMDKQTTEEEQAAKDYDVWDELKHYRSSFFMGSWVTKKFHPVGEDKVKKQLEDLEKKRAEEEARKKHDKEADGREWEKWKK